MEKAKVQDLLDFLSQFDPNEHVMIQDRGVTKPLGKYQMDKLCILRKPRELGGKSWDTVEVSENEAQHHIYDDFILINVLPRLWPV